MLILAFPGMGKTPLSKKSGKYLDLDFGHYRESLKVSKDDELRLMRPFARLVNMYESDGFIVLSNDPKLMEFTHVDHVYLPRNFERSARKLGVSRETIDEWVHDWASMADKHSVPVTFLQLGLDHYLWTAKGNSKGGDRK